MTPEKPKRAVVLELRVEGDTRAGVVSLLEDFLRQIRDRDGGGSSSVTGGYSSGGYYGITVNPDMTHERYVKELEDYLARRMEYTPP